MTSFRWQEKHTTPFIETYRRHECLWNTKSSDYKKSNVREKAYKSMVASLNLPGLTVADVKGKIKTIRSKYGAELTKIRVSELSGADDVYQPRLWWFKDADVFLRDVCASKFNSVCLRDLDLLSGKDTPSVKATNRSQHNEQLEQETSDVEVEENEASSPEMSDNSSAVASTVNGGSVKNSKKERKRYHYSSVPAIRESVKKLKLVPDDNEKYPNEFDVFCQSLAIQLKKMPLHRALICQEQLQSVMTKERLCQLSQSHPSMLPNSSNYQQSMDMSNSEKYYMTPSSGGSMHSDSD